MECEKGDHCSDNEQTDSDEREDLCKAYVKDSVNDTHLANKAGADTLVAKADFIVLWHAFLIVAIGSSACRLLIASICRHKTRYREIAKFLIAPNCCWNLGCGGYAE
mgnify:CR=1 FL=1